MSAKGREFKKLHFNQEGYVMKGRVSILKRLLVPLALGAITLMVVGFDGRSIVQAADPEMKIEVMITDQGTTYKAIRHPAR